MAARIGNEYREIKRKDGRTMVVRVEKRRNVCAELKRKSSARVRVARKGQI